MKRLYFSLVLILALNALQSQEQKLLLDPVSQCSIRYHYYPNLEAYYDLEKKMYLLKIDGQWTTRKEIPSGYRGYSLLNYNHVPITDYDDENPVQFLDRHRKMHPYLTLRQSRMLASSK